MHMRRDLEFDPAVSLQNCVLDSSHDHQYQDDYENKAQNAARAVTPSAAVWPSGSRADKKNNDNDEQDHTKRHDVTSRCSRTERGNMGQSPCQVRRGCMVHRKSSGAKLRA